MTSEGTGSKSAGTSCPGWTFRMCCFSLSLMLAACGQYGQRKGFTARCVARWRFRCQWREKQRPHEGHWKDKQLATSSATATAACNNREHVGSSLAVSNTYNQADTWTTRTYINKPAGTDQVNATIGNHASLCAGSCRWTQHHNQHSRGKTNSNSSSYKRPRRPCCGS